MTWSKKDLFPWLCWMAMILQGLVFISTTAIWEGFDEPFHYAYIQHLAEKGALPVYGKSLLSRELTHSFELAPLSIPFNSILAGRYTTFASYWRLPEEERTRRALALRALGAGDRTASDPENPISNYEAHHAPLYYLIAVPVYRMCSPLDLPTRVFCLRLFSLLIGSVTIFFAYAAAQRVLPGSMGPRAVAFVIALMPMVVGTIARISNDALAVPLGSLAAFLIIDYFASAPNPWRAIQIGLVLGLGLLSKAYFLAIVAAAAAAFAVACCRASAGKRLWQHSAVILGLAAAVSGWWYARNFLLYGNLSGLQELTLTGNISLADRFAMAARLPWLTAWHGMIKQHIWLGNMSLLELSRALYNVAYLLIIAAILGLTLRGMAAFRRLRSHREQTPNGCPVHDDLRTQDATLGIALLFYSMFLLAAAYHMWQNFILVRMPGGTGGYYLYAVIVPELLLLISGFQALPRLMGKIALACTIFYVVLVNFVAYFCKTIPYYGGIFIPRFHLSHLLELYAPASLSLILNHISLQQAVWIGPATLLALLGSHLCWMIFVSWRFVCSGRSARMD